MDKVKVAIVGPGNIGTDLMYKFLKRSQYMKLDFMAGIVKESEGLSRAKDLGIRTSYTGIQEILEDDEIKIVFEATSAKAHKQNAPLYKQANKIAIDLTPAAVGPYIIPSVNMEACMNEDNVNLVTCGGQATVPVVAAINSVCRVEYAEIVATISSKSAGPGTRQNIDEFTETTSKALEMLGGAKKGKAIILLNPADPPIMMRNTIYAKVSNPDMEEVKKAIAKSVDEISKYVPGYKVVLPPIWDGEKIMLSIQVTGAGDFLPEYAGNLDIITSAAVSVGDCFAQGIIKKIGGEL